MERLLLRNITGNTSCLENKQLILLNLNPEGIIEIELDPALSYIGEKELMYINEQIYVLGNGKKMPAYISFSGFLAIDDSGKKYRASSEYAQYRLANAFLTDTFSKVMLYNFYLDSYSSLVPVGSFPQKSRALNWLKTGL